MRIVQLTPGTGNFHCGNCIRDNTLVLRLRRMGHDALMVPMYLPHVVDGEHAGARTPLFFGGINVYLQHKLRLFRHTPAWIDRLFDGTGLLRWAAERSSMTTARDLGELTVAMLQGDEGTQNKELTKLIGYLRTLGGVDVVVLSNALLIGLARRLKRELGCAVVCTMAGEDGFLDALTEPWRSQSWQTLEARAGDVDRFIAVSDYYGSVMRQRLSLQAERVVTVYNGIEFAGYEPAASPPATPTVGFLARMCHAKGLATLVDAFIDLKQRDRVPGLKLLAVGAATAGDQPFIKELRDRLESAGTGEHAEFHTNVTHEQKLSLLGRMSVLSVPTNYGESFGLYMLEALAAGVPLVLPRRGAFPEIVDAVRGGILVEPDSAAALADGLEVMLLRGDEAREMALAARQRVLERFAAERMASDVAAVYEAAVASSRSHPAPQKANA
jgi:glycosyltransferase involved in cell wall biosynthesis